MLITEVDRLSSAWQTLDTQNRDKVLSLMQHEEKTARLLSEKAKADNRYFAAMRAKEALTAENLVLSKTSEKQSKALAASEEASKAQSAHIVRCSRGALRPGQKLILLSPCRRQKKLMEAEVAKHSQRVAECSRKLDGMTSQKDSLLAERESTAKQISDVRSPFP